jgi:hypothetical protein
MGKSLYVTDFDDTLAKTDSKVYIIHPSGEREPMTPGEYAVYNPKRGDKLDFSEFEKLINPRPINRFVNLLKKVTERKKTDKVSVLTARGHTKPIAKFLQMIGIKGKVTIAALGDADPKAKAKYIEKHIKDGYDKIAFIDDSKKNVSAVNKLKKQHPNIKLITHHVKDDEQHGAPTGKAPSQKTQSKSSPRISRKDFEKIYRSQIINPKTKKSVLVATALKDKNHPAHAQAMSMVTQMARQKNPNK